jgi:hypothetical protein
MLKKWNTSQLEVIMLIKTLSRLGLIPMDEGIYWDMMDHFTQKYKDER